mmetsp:Transcript_3789/g.7054  ORF Transcript_3789/g.7054 Transcript_3789/m.7054 type:complete len:211 (-) Transcript_3789:747-1379(-)
MHRRRGGGRLLDRRNESASSASRSPASLLRLPSRPPTLNPVLSAAFQPMSWDPTGRAKFDAWLSRRGTSPLSARRAYVAAVARLSAIGAPSDSASSFMDRRPSRPASPLAPPSSSREERLLSLAAAGDAAGLTTLLENWPEGATWSDPEGTTALHVAADRGEVEACVALLGAGADANAEDRDGIGVLETAEASERVEVEALLMDHGAVRK